MIKKIFLALLINLILITGAIALEDVYYYINKGDDYFFKYDFDSAIIYYQKARELDPENMLALFQIGESYLGKKLYENAANIYSTVLKSSENKEYIYQINSRALTLADEKRYKLSEKLLKSIINIDKKSVNTYIDLGYIYSQQGLHSKSLKEWLKAYSLSPTSDTILYDLGYAYHSLKKYNEAIKFYNECIKTNNKYINAHINLADIYLILKEYNKSIEESKKVISLNTSEHLGYYNLAEAEFELGQKDEALKHYLKAYDLKINDIDTLNRLGELYIFKNMKIEAKKYLDEALKVEPTNEKTLTLLKQV